jgi:hypothetical protein
MASGKRFTIYATAFAAGFALMGFEVFGVRVLTPAFGSGFHVWGALIAVVMTGLAAGYSIGGKMADKHSTWPLVAALLAVAGTLLLFFPFAAVPVKRIVPELISDRRLGALAAATLLFPLPTIALGALTPVLIKANARSLEGVGNASGSVQAVGTAGGVVGTLATAFLLIGTLPSSHAVAIFGAALIANAAVIKFTRL